MSEHKEPIPSRIYNSAVGGHVCGSEDIIDDDFNLEQTAINKELMGIPYDSGNPNGMGKIILKKTDNFKTVVEGQTDGNTIFVIKYDFVLTDDVTIPANCVLQFDGGSISGSYTITGANTVIEAGLVKIIAVNTTLAGTWGIKEWHPEWFGAKNDVTVNSTAAFQKCLDLCAAGGTTKISAGEFLLDTLYIPFGTNNHLEGSGTGTTILRMNSAPLITTRDYDSTPNATDGGSIGNFSIRARSGQSKDDTTNVAIKHCRRRHTHLHDLSLLRATTNDSKLYAFIECYGDFTYNTYIDRVLIEGFGDCKYGIKTTAKNNDVNANSNIVNIHDCMIYSNNMEACVDMSCVTQYEITGCLFESSGKHAIILGQAGVIQGNWAEGFTDEVIKFQNNLGTVVSASNRLGKNYFATTTNVHVPIYCGGNNIKDLTLIGGKIVKDTNSIDVIGLSVSEPTFEIPPRYDGIHLSKSKAEVRGNVWHLEYTVYSDMGANLELGLVTTEIANVKNISASAYDIWGNVNLKANLVAARGEAVVINGVNSTATMIIVYVEFC